MIVWILTGGYNPYGNDYPEVFTFGVFSDEQKAKDMAILKKKQLNLDWYKIESYAVK